MKKSLPLLLLVPLLAPAARADVRRFSARLDGAQEVPPVASGGLGAAELDVDAGSGLVSVVGDYRSLGSPAVAARLHAGAAGQNGPVLVDLLVSGGTNGAFQGHATLAPSDLQALLAGDTYVNVLTVAQPLGEVRGQALPASVRWTFGLDGSQMVPPVSTPATGICTLILDPSTGEVQAEGSYQDLKGVALAAHLHGPADPGQNGGVLVQLTHTGGFSGTIRGSGVLSPTDTQEALAGRTYVVVHSIFAGGGEIRGQAVPSVLGTSFCVALPHSGGGSARIEATGSARVSDLDFHLTARELPASQIGYFLASRTIEPVYPVVGSEGRLCIAGGPIARFAHQAQSSGSAGAFRIDVDLTAIPLDPPVAIQPGECWGFQAWFRDVVGGGRTSNFTDAVSVVFE